MQVDTNFVQKLAKKTEPFSNLLVNNQQDTVNSISRKLALGNKVKHQHVFLITILCRLLCCPVTPYHFNMILRWRLPDV